MKHDVAAVVHEGRVDCPHEGDRAAYTILERATGKQVAWGFLGDPAAPAAPAGEAVAWDSTSLMQALEALWRDAHIARDEAVRARAAEAQEIAASLPTLYVAPPPVPAGRADAKTLDKAENPG